MQINVLGTGGAVDELSTSYIVNNTILVDCGIDIIKKIIKSNEIASIDTLFLTHLHMDHVSGLELLIYYIQFVKKDNFKIYAGLDFIDFYKQLKCSLSVNSEYYQPFDFIEIKHMDNIDCNDYLSCNILKTIHMNGSIESYSFTFIENKERIVRVIISGDTDTPLLTTNRILEKLNVYCFHDMGWTGVKNKNIFKAHPTELDVLDQIGASKRVFGIHLNDNCVLEHFNRAEVKNYTF